MTSEVNHLVRNRHLVESLEQSLRSGKHGLSVVPSLLRRLLVEESWREFTTQRDELVRHGRFADFVITPPLKGLGASVDLIRRVIGSDAELLDLLDQALQRPDGGSRKISLTDDIVNTENDQGRPHGSSRQYALRRLRKDAPELHEEVLAGRLSAHAAMVQAGFRPKTFSVRADNPASVVRALRNNTTPEFWAQLRQLIQAEAT